ncbi:hypothetical protein KXS11_12590 [Plantibacter flavus]|uniref:hypothetical protein n=1 Tax=Plantibacter flavus TaxID=150123 RepID=UPI003F14DAF3
MTTEPESGRDEPSPETVAFLIDSGTFTEESWAQAVAAVARGDLAARERKTAQRALEATITSAIAGARLGVGAAEVERLRSTGNLYAFRSQEQWRYPDWQFTGDRQHPLLPHLAPIPPYDSSNTDHAALAALSGELEAVVTSMTFDPMKTFQASRKQARAEFLKQGLAPKLEALVAAIVPPVVL